MAIRRGVLGLVVTLGVTLTLSGCFWPPGGPGPGGCEVEDAIDTRTVVLDGSGEATFDACVRSADDEDWFTFTAAEAGLLEVTCVASPVVIWAGDTPDASGSWGTCEPSPGDVESAELEPGESVTVYVFASNNLVDEELYTLTFGFTPAD